MQCCYLKSDTSKSDALVLRTFGTLPFEFEGGEPPKIDRDYEVMGLQIAARIGVAQPVYALYKNGIVYGYATGRTVEPNDLKDPKVIRYSSPPYIIKTKAGQ